MMFLTSKSCPSSSQASFYSPDRFSSLCWLENRENCSDSSGLQVESSIRSGILGHPSTSRQLEINFSHVEAPCFVVLFLLYHRLPCTLVKMLTKSFRLKKKKSFRLFFVSICIYPYWYYIYVSGYYPLSYITSPSLSALKFCKMQAEDLFEIQILIIAHKCFKLSKTPHKLLSEI